MAHAMILATMREMGRAAGRELASDPMNGYLANLDPDDYKRFFRPYLPQTMRGSDFIPRCGSTIDMAAATTPIDPDVEYHVQQSADHHVLEARRVRRFCEFVEQAARLRAGPDLALKGPPCDQKRYALMDKAGHLMYASHLSYTNDAMLGSDECDLLVQLVRSREKAGLYGARITAGGCGGTVAVLCETGERPDRAIAEIMKQYEKRSGRKAELLAVEPCSKGSVR